MKYLCVLCITVASAALTAAQQPGPAERALASVWRQHIANPDDHTRVVHLCGLFKSKNPDTPLLVVSDGLTAWHLLKLGQTNAAVKVLEGMLTKAGKDAHLQAAANDMARAWLTRIDREETVRTLRRVYLDKVEYPISLDGLAELPADRKPPLTDRWGKRWSYQLAGFKYIRGVTAQRYQLHSVTLGQDSDLTAALARSYASGINLVPTKLLTSPRLAVEFGARSGDDGLRGPSDLRRRPRPAEPAKTKVEGKIRLAPGQDADGIRLAYLGKTGIILTDRDHWLVLPKPPRGK